MRREPAALLVLVISAGAASHGAGQVPQEPAPPVFRVSVENVYLDAFVTQGGRPVGGLRASDFELKDDGVVQSPELLGVDAAPLLAILAFDTSGSVAGEKLEALRAAGGAFLDVLRPGDQVGLLRFREDVGWMTPPTSDRDAVRLALGRMAAGGATSMLDALYAAIVLPGTETRSLVVLFSDGEDNVSWLDEAQVRQVAERSNALVHIVAIRPREAPSAAARGPEPAYIRGLRRVAEVTGGRLWSAESPSRLTAAFAAVAAAMNERYVLRYEPEGVARAGWHRIELRLRGRSGDVQTRAGYWIGPR
jgi:VWFA-related protein